MRSYTRHQLKQDSFRTTTTETITWAMEHRSKLIAAAIAVGVVVALILGGWAYINYRDRQAQSELAGAMQKYGAPIRPEGTPASSEMLTFASAQERAKVTNAEFARIAGKFPFTQSAQVARYFEGITFRDMGDNAAAERELQKVASGRYKEVGSLANLALASLYHTTGRDSQAVALYKELAEHPTDSVGKSAAQFMLAALYEDRNEDDQARALYQQMQKESPTSPVAQLAGQKLQALKQ